MSGGRQDGLALVEDAVTRLIVKASLQEIGDDLARGFARQTAAALGEVCRMLGIDDAAGPLQAVFAVDPDAAPSVQAEHLASALSAAVGYVWPHSSTAEPPDEPPGTQGRAEPRDDQQRARVEEMLTTLFEADAPALAELAAFEEEAGPTTEDTTAPPSRWRLESVEAILTRMLAFSREVGLDDPERARKYPHRVRFEESLAVELELRRLDTRYQAAQQFAEQARRNPAFRSPGRAVGNDVHSALQTRYLMAYSAENVVVQEWWVYLPGSPERTITEQAERELRKPDPARRDYTFAVIEMARLPRRGRLSGKSRWDTLDLSRARLFEIKPLVRLHEGVLQESYYRYKYCFCALHLLDEGLRILVPWIEPGEDYQVTDPITRELHISTRFGRLALPFNVMPAFPGVVPYVLLRDTEQQDMVRLLLHVMAWLREQYKNVKRLLLRLRALILITILVIAVVALVVVLVLVVLARAMQEATAPPKPKQLPAPSEEAVRPIGTPSREKVPTFISARPGPGHAFLDVGVRSGAEETMSVRFGRVTVAGLPAAQFGEFSTMAVTAVDAALGMLSRLPDPPPTKPPS